LLLRPYIVNIARLTQYQIIMLKQFNYIVFTVNASLLILLSK